MRIAIKMIVKLSDEDERMAQGYPHLLSFLEAHFEAYGCYESVDIIEAKEIPDEDVE